MPEQLDQVQVQALITAQTAGFEKALKKVGDDNVKTVRKISKTWKKGATDDTKAITSFFMRLTKGQKIIQGLEKDEKKFRNELKRVTQAIADGEKEMGRLNDAIKEASDPKQLDDLQKKLAEVKKQFEGAKEHQIEVVVDYKEAKKNLEEISTSMGGKIKWGEEGKKAGKWIAEPFDKLLSKDLEGFVTSAAQKTGTIFEVVIGKAFGKGAKSAGKSMKDWGAGMVERGKTRAEQGGMKAKMAGLAQQGLGKVAKGAGAASGAIGSGLKALGKAGPALAAVVTGLMGLVRAFLDADAEVKEFQKGIIEVSGNAGAMARNFNNAGLAVQEIQDDLDKLRAQANDFRKNNRLGITPKEHSEVIQSLVAEGVSLHTVAQGFAEAQAKGEAFASVFANNTEMAVAYSRSMGISLQEVTKMQGHMMAEMGMSLGESANQFQKMTNAIQESGMAGSKFTNVINGMMNDMNIFNNRMEDSVKLLGKLGKIMSPQNAAKFMQFAQSALKGLSRTEKIKAGLLMGPKKLADYTAKALKGNTEAVSKELVEKTGATEAEVSKAIDAANKGDRSLTNALIDRAKAEDQGKLREAVSELGSQARGAKKGFVGQAMNLGKGDVVSNLEAMRDVAVSITGKKTIGEVEGTLGGEKAAEVLAGMTQEQQGMVRQLEEMVEDQRKALGAKGEGLGWKEIINTMDKSKQDQIKNMTDTRSVAEKQGDQVISYMQKFENFMKWFQNQFYNAMMKIVDFLTSRFGSDEEKKDMAFFNSMKGQKLTATDQEALAAAREAAPGQAEAAFLKVTGEAIQKQADATRAMASAMEEEQVGDEMKQLLSRGVAPDAKTFKGTPDDAAKAWSAEIPSTIPGVGPPPAPPAAATKGPPPAPPAVAAAATKGPPPPGTPAGAQSALAGTTGAKGTGAAPQGMLMKGAKGMGIKPPAVAAGVQDPKDLPVDIPLTEAPPSPVMQEATEAGEQAKFKALERGATFQEAAAAGIEAVEATLDKGVMLNKQGWASKIQPTVDKGMLEQLRTALFEYYMYNQIKPEDMMKALQAGKSPDEIGKLAVEAGKKGIKAEQALGITDAEPNAAGGLVTSIAGGMANVLRPPAGEGFAAVGRGERIVPAGGGGNQGPVVVELRLTGDLERMIEAKASDVQARNVVLSRAR